MSSFFTAPASQRKRKRTDEQPSKSIKRRGVERKNVPREGSKENTRRLRPVERDESVSGSESEDNVEAGSQEDSEATSEEDENAADRRIRLAQRYLDNLKQEVDETGFDAEEIDKDIIAQRLKEDVDEVKGRQFRLIATTLNFKGARSTSFRADTQSTTAVAVRQPYAYTVSKDKTLIKWKLVDPIVQGQNGHVMKKVAPPKRRPKQMAYVKGVKVNASAVKQHGHSDEILSLAVSPDGHYVATGGADKKLIIWSADTLQPLKTFMTHRDSVTGLDFAPSSSQSGFGAQLFSASSDRSLKTYSLAGEESLAYVETLFGHQDHVLAVSAMGVDQCVSVGARDRTARLWKVVDETQLKFLGDSSRRDTYHTGSLECVTCIPPSHFVTGSDSGALSLWNIHRKKPLFTIQTAHGVDEPPALEEVTSEGDPRVIESLKKDDRRPPIPRSITALAALPGTDVLLSGSWDGYIRVWKVSDDKRSLVALGTLGIQSGTHRRLSDNEKEQLNGTAENGVLPQSEHMTEQPIHGVINSIALFERRKEVINEFGGKKEGDCMGLCIVIGTGKEMRLGRWRKFPKGKNGAAVFEVPLLTKEP